MARLLKNHRATIYRLEREWGQAAALYRPAQTNNITTGKVTRSYVIYPMLRVAILPETMNRAFTYDKAYIESGFYDKMARWVIIDARKLSVVPDLNDYLIFDAAQYEIKSIQTVEKAAAYRIRITKVKNTANEKWAYALDKIIFSIAASMTIISTGYAISDSSITFSQTLAVTRLTYVTSTVTFTDTVAVTHIWAGQFNFALNYQSGSALLGLGV